MHTQKIIKLPTESSFFDVSINHKQIIRPIRIQFGKGRQKQYDSQFNKTFCLRGYKYVPKMAAVGHRTEENLKLIKKSTVKMVKNIEFDA